jgi:quinoprotein glucose dehydrogenase
VAVINKPGLLFLFDRVTGKPIYGIEERPVPQSEVPLERTAKTQPFPVKPAPLARQSMSAADVATVTPELEAACRKLMEGLQLGGPYLPVSYNRLRVQFPGNHGGVNWGGVSFNPQLGYLLSTPTRSGRCPGCATATRARPGRRGPRAQGIASIPTALPRRAGGGRFRDEASNMMCQQPPWGN